jgi:hypothetical protein
VSTEFSIAWFWHDFIKLWTANSVSFVKQIFAYSNKYKTINILIKIKYSDDKI